MPVSCPKCKSRFLKMSRARTLSEHLNKLRFILPLRCGDCKTRFTANTLIWSDIKYARCPSCLRMDLNAWTKDDFVADWISGIKLKFGARIWRCEYCRLNFASFRKRLEVFSFRRWQKLNDQAPK